MGCGNAEDGASTSGTGSSTVAGGVRGSSGASTVGAGGLGSGTGGADNSGGSINAGGGGDSSGATTGSAGSTGAGGSSTGAGGARDDGSSTGAGARDGGSSTGAGGARDGGSSTGGGGARDGGSSTGGGGGGPATDGGVNTGTCTASKAASAKPTGSGPHKVTVETNSAAGINEGTIFRPTDLGGAEKYPIFVWGEGGCSLNGLSNSVAMAEIASHGYFVIADGTPNNNASRNQDSGNPAGMGKPLLAYVTWAIAENDKPCSAYYQSLEITKVAANGFSCGGLMAEGTAGDPRITTWGLNSSGLFAANQAFYKTIHTPVLIVLGGSSDIAYANGERDYDNISALGIPILLFSKQLGHGGDLFASRGGDFTKIDLAWLNWQLKGDETATGKGLLVGAGCTYCKDSAWEVKSKNVP
jgi:hypothetical protein